MRLDKYLRKVVPSVAVLGRTPMAVVLDAADYILRKIRPEWADLPPASLRIRIGVGNQILRNHRQFIDSGNDLVSDLARRGYFSPNARVLELGCGCGRNAVAFARLLSADGFYVGQDVDRRMVRWCRENLERENVRFYHANIFSSVYNPDGISMRQYSLPAPDASMTLTVALSVFSHLLYADFVRYVAECARVLASGGHMHLSVFLLDSIEGRLGDRWTFAHRMEGCRVESLKYPEAAVAYDHATVERILAEHGLSIVEIYGHEHTQQTIIARKG